MYGVRCPFVRKYLRSLLYAATISTPKAVICPIPIFQCLLSALAAIEVVDGGEAVSERKRAFGGGQNSTLKERATPREIC